MSVFDLAQIMGLFRAFRRDDTLEMANLEADAANNRQQHPVFAQQAGEPLLDAKRGADGVRPRAFGPQSGLLWRADSAGSTPPPPAPREPGVVGRAPPATRCRTRPTSYALLGRASGATR